MVMVAVIFWACIILASVPFIWYPLFMAWIGRRAKPRAPSEEFLPSVTIIVAAYNEEKNIAHTLESLLAQDYPPERFKIEVFSDGSTDKTDEVVRTFAQRGVRLSRFEGRIGKTECQNRMVARVPSEIVAFADGNLQWDKKSLRALMQPFLQEKVAATTGELILMRDGTAEKTDEGLFRRVDEKIKAGESEWLSSIGVNGPIYAVRKNKFIKLRPWLVSDLVLPVLLVAQGYQVTRAPDARAVEPATPTLTQEFKRKRRLVTQGFVALPILLRAALLSRNHRLLFMLTAHKFLRWMGAELLLTAIVLSTVLAQTIFYLYEAILALEIFIIALALVGLLPGARAVLPGTGALSYFLVTNVASLFGLFDFIRGKRAATWSTERKNQ